MSEKLLATLIEIVLGVVTFVVVRIFMGFGKTLLIKFRTRKTIAA